LAQIFDISKVFGVHLHPLHLQLLTTKWHVSYYLYYDYPVSLTTISVQLHMQQAVWQNAFVQTL